MRTWHHPWGAIETLAAIDVEGGSGDVGSRRAQVEAHGTRHLAQRHNSASACSQPVPTPHLLHYSQPSCRDDSQSLVKSARGVVCSC